MLFSKQPQSNDQSAMSQTCAVGVGNIFIIFYESNMLAFHTQLREIHKLFIVNGLNRMNL
jgi:hypothetical protein